jgi:hypothetical protein
MLYALIEDESLARTSAIAVNLPPSDTKRWVALAQGRGRRRRAQRRDHSRGSLLPLCAVG